MLMAQLLSLKVVRAPVPDLLPVNSVSCWRRRPEVECRVVVKESQLDSGMRVEKLDGWPKLLLSRPSWCQRAHDSSEWGSAAAVLAGGDMLLPILEEDVMEPRVMRQMSAGWTSMTPVIPCSTMWMMLTVVFSGLVYDKLVTFVSEVHCH